MSLCVSLPQPRREHTCYPPYYLPPLTCVQSPGPLPPSTPTPHTPLSPSSFRCHPLTGSQFTAPCTSTSTALHRRHTAAHRFISTWLVAQRRLDALSGRKPHNLHEHHSNPLPTARTLWKAARSRTWPPEVSQPARHRSFLTN